MRNVLYIVLILLQILISGSVSARDYIFVAHEFPPVSFSENGHATGGFVDVMSAVCEKLKVHCQFEIQDLEDAASRVDFLEADGLLGLYPATEAVSRKYTTEPIVKLHLVYQALAAHKVAPKSDLLELSGHTVISVRKSILKKTITMHTELVDHVRHLEENEFETIVENMGQEKYGPHPLIAAPAEVIRYLGKKHGKDFDTVLPLDTRSLVATFSKKLTESEVGKFNLAIQEFKKDGTLKKLLAPYGLEVGE